MIRGPLAIRKAWDDHKSLHHKYVLEVSLLSRIRSRWADEKVSRDTILSYAALGLARTAGPPVKGESAPVWPVRPTSASQSAPTAAAPETSTAASTLAPSSSAPDLPKGFGRIVRDADGKVLRVEMSDVADPEADKPEPAWLREPLNPLDENEEWDGLDAEQPKNEVIAGRIDLILHLP